VFVLYAVPLGLIAGWLSGGSLDRLAGIRFRWAPAAIGGLLAQIVLFSTPIGVMAGELVPVLYVATTGLVLTVVAVNFAVPGMVLVLLGAVSNLIAIVANGGYMPASPDALAFAGLSASDGPTNSVVLTDPRFPYLTDVFGLPDWVPFANVFSAGDVLIGVGIVLAIRAGMRREPQGPASDPSPPTTDPAPVTGRTSLH
jgi:hypothetical protein